MRLETKVSYPRQVRPQTNGVVGMSAAPPGPPSPFRTAGRALIDWWRAATLDALIVGGLWLIGLELIRVPWAPLWALLGAFLQLIPVYGAMIALIGPALAVALQGSEEWWRLGLVLGLYGLIVMLDGLVIGPYLLHRKTRVPWWAALLGPVVLGLLIPPWGVILAPPLLAVIFAFRDQRGPQP
jgi:predicted PurR-regulated permease PerM